MPSPSTPAYLHSGESTPSPAATTEAPRQFRFISKDDGEEAMTAARGSHAPRLPRKSAGYPSDRPSMSPGPQFRLSSSRLLRTARAASASVAPVVIRSSTRTTRPRASTAPPPGTTLRAPATLAARPSASSPLWSDTRRRCPRRGAARAGDSRPAQLRRRVRGHPAHRVVTARPHGPRRRGNRHQQDALRPRQVPTGRARVHDRGQYGAQHTRQPERPTLLVLQQQGTSRPLVRNGGPHGRKPGGGRVRPYRTRHSTAELRQATSAEPRPVRPAPGAVERQHQVAERLPPPCVHAVQTAAGAPAGPEPVDNRPLVDNSVTASGETVPRATFRASIGRCAGMQPT